MMRDFLQSHFQRGTVAMTALVLILNVPVTVAPSPLVAQNHTVPASEPDTFDIYVAEAASRFAIPQRWILAVMEVESAGNPRAVSRAGAVGLMQIMPTTWAELRTDYQLGDDPFDPRDNIMAGAAYLRQMYDQFGSPGFLAAYNAGPARYENHLNTGRALPLETRNYLAILSPIISDERAVAQPQSLQDWRETPLFVPTAETARDPRDGGAATIIESLHEGIFVPLSQEQSP